MSDARPHSTGGLPRMIRSQRKADAVVLAVVATALLLAAISAGIRATDRPVAAEAGNAGIAANGERHKHAAPRPGGRSAEHTTSRTAADHITRPRAVISASPSAPVTTTTPAPAQTPPAPVAVASPEPAAPTTQAPAVAPPQAPAP